MYVRCEKIGEEINIITEEYYSEKNILFKLRVYDERASLILRHHSPVKASLVTDDVYGPLSVTMDSIFVPFLTWIEHLPTTSRKCVLIPLIPMSLHDFSSVRFIFLNRRISLHTDVIMDVKTNDFQRM